MILLDETPEVGGLKKDKVGEGGCFCFCFGHILSSAEWCIWHLMDTTWISRGRKNFILFSSGVVPTVPNPKQSFLKANVFFSSTLVIYEE